MDTDETFDPCNSYQSISVPITDEEKHDAGQSEQPADGASETTGFISMFRSFTNRQRKFFISLIFLSLVDAVGFSSITPFFALVATSKGLTELQTGIIFSAYSAAGIVSAIIIGSWIGKLGAKFCVISGMIWSFTSTACLGILLNTTPESFFYLSVICRAYMGFGMNASYTAMMALIFQEFGSRSVTVISMSEALIAIGTMVGPVLGGGLYSVGGYVVPFIVLSIIQVLLTICCYVSLPSHEVERPAASVPPIYLLLSFSGFVCFLVVAGTFMFNSFTIAFMPTFLNEQFDFNALNIAVCGLVGSVSYSVMSPMWGYATDLWPNALILELGLLGFAFAYALAGPATVIKHLFGWNKQRVWLVYVYQVIGGTFFGATLMQTFQLAENGFKDLKLTDSDITKYGLISGLWNMAYSVGDIAGPSLGGLMLSKFGFEDTLGIFSLILLFMILLNFLLRIVRRHRIRKEERRRLNSNTNDDERSPLLVNQ